VIVKFDTLCQLDLDNISLLIPDGCPPILSDVPLAAPNNLDKEIMNQNIPKQTQTSNRNFPNL
jgi:hypothetical protein